MAASDRRMDGALRLCSNIARRFAHWLLLKSNALDARLARSTVAAHVALQPPICQHQRIQHWVREPSPFHSMTSSRDFHRQLLGHLGGSNDSVAFRANAAWKSCEEGDVLLRPVQEVVDELCRYPRSAKKSHLVQQSSNREDETIGAIMARCPASTWLAYLKMTGQSPKKAKPLYAALSKMEMSSLEEFMERREALARLSDYPCKMTPALKKRWQCASLQDARERWTQSAQAKRPLRALIQEIALRLDTHVLSQSDRLQLTNDYNSIVCFTQEQFLAVGTQQSGSKKSFG